METTFFVKSPVEGFWDHGAYIGVIEAKSLREGTTPEWLKVANTQEELFEVMSPKEYKGRQIEKGDWTECKGPVRKLQMSEYIRLTLKDKNSPLPPGWVALTK